MIFARLQEIWILNKREEGAVESLTAVPACQRHRKQESTLAGECSPTVSFSGGSKGISVLLESSHVDRGRWFKGGSNGKGSLWGMAA